MNKLNSPESDSCPDPWQAEDLKTQKDMSAELWPIPQETYPLIGPAGPVGAKQLMSHIIKPIELLLQDWLKLKTSQATPLAQQWQEAVALVYWMQTQTQEIH